MGWLGAAIVVHMTVVQVEPLGELRRGCANAATTKDDREYKARLCRC